MPPETKIREVIQGLMEYEVLVSLPEHAGLGVQIEKAVPCIRRMMNRTSSPLRVEGVANDGVIRTFIFGETSKMKESPSYLNEFINMARYTAGAGAVIGTINV